MYKKITFFEILCYIMAFTMLIICLISFNKSKISRCEEKNGYVVTNNLGIMEQCVYKENSEQDITIED